MKPFLLLAFLALPLYCFSQKTFVQDGKLNGILPLNQQGQPEYQIIGTVNNTPKAELFKRARKWFTKTYNSAKQVLQTNDPETGELSGRGAFYAKGHYMVTASFPILHLLSVEVKNDKYRITLTNFSMETNSYAGPIDQVPMVGRKFYDSLYTSINIESISLLASLEKTLNTPDDF